MSTNNKNRRQGGKGGNIRSKDFEDFAEESDRKEYLMFCSEIGPLYSRSFNYLIFSIFILLILSYFYKWFILFIILNLITWNTSMQMDWDELHGQLDDMLDESDPDIKNWLYNPFLFFLFKKFGTVGKKENTLTRYSKRLLIYDKEKIDNNFYNIITKKKKRIIKKKLIKFVVDYDYKYKKLDKFLIKNYKSKNTALYRNWDLKDLYISNNNIYENIIKCYYKKGQKKINYVYIDKFLYKTPKSWYYLNKNIKNFYLNRPIK